MFSSLSAVRVRRIPLYRILNRFRLWMEISAIFRRLKRSRTMQETHRHLYRPDISRHLRQSREGSVFEMADVSACIRQLRENGYWQGLQLPKDLVAEIRRFAEETFCSRHPHDPERFLIAEVCNGRSPLGAPVAVADVNCALPCEAIDRVAADPLLADVSRRYLGYAPKQVKTRLYWSPVSDLSDEERRENGQTVDFHYDIEPTRALYVFFYITPADRESGAHVAMARSHRIKSLPMIFSSSFQPEGRVLAHYGEAAQIVIKGGAGYGFLEDPAAFHKVLVPRKRERLVLQLRYS